MPIDPLQTELAQTQATVDTLLEGFQPSEFPSVPGLAFDVLYRPASTLDRLGGDWYDIFMLRDGRVAFTIGDVCGHGLAAAVKMGQAKQAVKVAASLRTNDPMPRAVMDQTNEVIFLNGHDVQFTTAIYGVIDTASRRVTYACAGHHPPILAKPGAVSEVMPNHGFPLGVEIDLPDLIREHDFFYDSGWLLILYTDGLVEFSHDAAEGEARLLDVSRDAIERNQTRPAKFIVDNMLLEKRGFKDDVAVMTILFA